MTGAPLLERLFAFNGLVVIGATPRNPYAKSILEGLESIGYAGEVACINPNGEAVGDVRGFAGLADVPFRADAAVVVIRAERVPAVLEECGRAGVRSVTVISSGFAEAGEAGRALQSQLATIAERFGIALCGPNCMGFASLHDRTSTYSRSRLPARAGDVAVVSHSGGMLNEVLSYGSYRGIGFSKVVSSGNEAVLSLADYLDHLVDDEATTTIGLIIEGIRAAQRVRSAFARAAAARKPIVAIKIGSSALAAASAATHTGAIVGSADLFAALCEQYGVTLVEDIDELCESLLMFSRGRRLIVRPGEVKGTAVVEISGGGRGLVCDLAERGGLPLPAPAESTVSRMRELLGEGAAPTNPLDLVISWESPKSVGLHAATLEALVADGAYDVVVSRLSVPSTGPIEAALEHGRLIERMQEAHPEMLFTVLGRASDAINPSWQEFCARSGVTYLQGYKRGLGALAYLHRYRKHTALSRDDPAAAAEFPVYPRGAGLLDEVESKDVLAAVGLPVNAARFAANVDDALAAAEQIGYPVVVKGISPRVVHKSDEGFVVLDVSDPHALRRIASDMLARLHALGGTDARRVGLSVQRRIPAGIEVIVGSYRDAVYGPVVLCGLGGIFAETLDERFLWLAPVVQSEVARRLENSKIARLARGFRTLPTADLAPLGALIAKLSAWVAADDCVSELDLNPIILCGAQATIVDARILMRNPEETRRPAR
jgi:acyl-CoA synthetase (NDP forming)